MSTITSCARSYRNLAGPTLQCLHKPTPQPNPKKQPQQKRQQIRHQSTTTRTTTTQPSPHALLEKPTWSVRSLLPSKPKPNPTTPSTTPSTPPSTPPPTTTEKEEEITGPQLRHLLRLSALPPPSSPAAEARMIATLSSQLHFVRAIQQVDTTGVPPLGAIRDETAAGLAEATIGMERLRTALEAEEAWGRCRRPRRRRDRVVEMGGAEDWDVLGTASQKVGRYFVVRSGKGSGEVAEAGRSRREEREG